MTASTFRKKPLAIQAIQWTGDNLAELREFAGTLVSFSEGLSDTCDWERGLRVRTATNGWVPVPVGEWILKGVQSEFYPCADRIFRTTYDPAPVHGSEAFLVAHLRHNPRTGGHAVAYVNIYSEGSDSLTGEHGTTYADLLQCDGSDFQDATDRLLAMIRSYPHLRWTLRWVEEKDSYQRSADREAFLRSVNDSFSPTPLSGEVKAAVADAMVSMVEEQVVANRMVADLDAAFATGLWDVWEAAQKEPKPRAQYRLQLDGETAWCEHIGGNLYRSLNSCLDSVLVRLDSRLPLQEYPAGSELQLEQGPSLATYDGRRARLLWGCLFSGEDTEKGVVPFAIVGRDLSPVQERP